MHAAWLLKFSESFHICSLLMQAEQASRPLCRHGGDWGAEAEDPGVSWTVAQLDLDFCPLPPGLGPFRWT